MREGAGPSSTGDAGAGEPQSHLLSSHQPTAIYVLFTQKCLKIPLLKKKLKVSSLGQLFSADDFGNAGVLDGHNKYTELSLPLWPALSEPPALHELGAL